MAKLTEEDMQSVTNMKLIEAVDSRKTSKGTFSLKFDSAKVNINSKVKLATMSVVLRPECN